MFGLLGFGGVAGAIIAVLRWRWDAHRLKREEQKPPPDRDMKVLAENSTASTASATGNILNVHFPTAVLSPPPTPLTIEIVPVEVELLPWRGKGDKMYLTVTNRGAKEQAFQAQCRILARRNDQNATQFVAFDLQWQYGGQSYRLIPGQLGNLLIASAGDNGKHEWQWMQLESAVGQPKPQRSDWKHGDPLPEYDIEISILGDKANKAYSERFTVRAGTECALEMYQRFVRIDVPANGTEINHREYLVRGSAGIPHAKIQLWVYAGGEWHPQANVSVNRENSFEGTCCFGSKESTRGEFKVRAVADGNLEIKKYKTLPGVGVQSEDVTVYLKRTLQNIELQTNIVGEIESGKFTIRTASNNGGTITHSTNLCVRLRVTNRDRSEATVKRAELEMTVKGSTYRGVRMSICDPRHGVDLLSEITNKNPIRYGVASIGSLEFWIQGLECPDHVIEADVRVTLIDEFDQSHIIRNKSLRIS